MPDDHAFAVRNEEQYRPVETVADQHVPVHDAMLPCHASRRLEAPGPGIQRLLVVVHGALRNADSYFAHAQKAGRDHPDTLIVAPQFLAGVDAPASALYWDVEGWKGGEPALGPAPVSSFTAMDALLRRTTEAARLADAANPSVVIFGNSAGGQYVNRYAAVGRAPDDLARRGIPVRFIIANPSTYLYFSQERPVAVPKEPGINRWRYGFDGAPAYVDSDARTSLERYLARDVAIVLGAEDSDDAALLLEVSPAAMAQGANRLERGIRYDQHVRGLARAAGRPAAHRLITLAGVGHAAADVLAAPQARELMFSRGAGCAGAPGRVARGTPPGRRPPG